MFSCLAIIVAVINWCFMLQSRCGIPDDDNRVQRVEKMLLSIVFLVGPILWVLSFRTQTMAHTQKLLGRKIPNLIKIPGFGTMSGQSERQSGAQNQHAKFRYSMSTTVVK